MSDEGLKLEKDLCRCCQAEGRFRSLMESPKGEESFAEMLRIALDIDLKPMSDPLDRKMYAICEACVRRLEDADTFKQQVLGCERVFQQLYAGDLIKVVGPTYPSTTTITIKGEECSDEDFSSRDDIPLDVPMDLEDHKANKLGHTLMIELPPKHDDDDDEDSLPDIRESKSLLQTILVEPLTQTDRRKPAPKKPAARKTYKPRTKPKPKSKPKTLDEKVSEAIAKKEQKEKGKEKKEKKKKKEKKPDGENADGETSKGGNEEFRVRESDFTIHGGKIKCTHCDKLFSTLTVFRPHLKALHLGLSKAKKCSHCSELCASTTELVYHKLEKHNIDERFKCNACDNAFVTKQFLNFHLNSYHKLGQPIQCKVCDFECYGEQRIRKHMIKHKTEKEFQCRFCMKLFPRKGALVYHERIHTGDRRKVCKECGQAFVQKASLNYHMGKHHPGVPF